MGAAVHADCSWNKSYRLTLCFLWLLLKKYFSVAALIKNAVQQVVSLLVLFSRPLKVEAGLKGHEMRPQSLSGTGHKLRYGLPCWGPQWVESSEKQKHALASHTNPNLHEMKARRRWKRQAVRRGKFGASEESVYFSPSSPNVVCYCVHCFMFGSQDSVMRSHVQPFQFLCYTLIQLRHSIYLFPGSHIILLVIFFHPISSCLQVLRSWSYQTQPVLTFYVSPLSSQGITFIAFQSPKWKRQDWSHRMRTNTLFPVTPQHQNWARFQFFFLTSTLGQQSSPSCPPTPICSWMTWSRMRCGIL